MTDLKPGDRFTIRGVRVRKDGTMTIRCKPGNESTLVVVDSTTDVWISTGKAARLLGYHPASFPRKFLGVIPSMRTEGGNYRWLASAVEHLAAPEDPEIPQAG